MDIRVASYNASLNRSNAGDLITDLSTSEDSQAQSVAEIIQRTNPDVLLINEFDFDANGDAAALFQQNYLGVSQNGQAPIDYPYVYVAPSNTGVPSGFDLDNSGAAGDFAPGDAQGFGFFEGQFGFVIYSKHPIDTENVRTFQTFLWKDMPGALLPADPQDADGNGDTSSWYTAEELEVLRLSSKNHVDLPVLVDGETVHILAAHPTPPVFDGPEDRNGTRNHDEIRFWADYVEGADYIYDDNGQTGGLEAGARFVIVGDYNADPFDGDSVNGAANQLLDHPLINGSATDPSVTPSSEGGTDAADRQAGANEGHTGNPAFDTADFGFAGFTDGVQNPDNAPGNLRVDYALPSEAGLSYLDGGVFWQAAEDPLFPLAEFPTSDHRLVYTDLRVTNDNRKTVEGVEFLGLTEIPSFTEFESTVFGGISGIAMDAVTGNYLGISDDFGSTVVNRFYEIAIDLSDGRLDDGDVTIEAVTELDPNGFVPGSADTEGVAIGEGGQIYISTERNTDGRFPQILEVARDGTVTGEFDVDAKFEGTADDIGVRNNLGFESLTISPDHSTLWAATEGALTQDGPRAGLDNASAARIIKYDLESGDAVAEFIYEVDPIAFAPNPEGAFADSGLVELLAIDDQGTMLALERSFSIGAPERGYTGKLYLVQTQGATNVIGEDAIPVLEDEGEIEFDVDAPVKKTLLADLGADFGIVVDNIEGMTLGPVLEDGRQSLIIVSDDNFSAFGPQANQFIALALDIEDVPTLTPVLETPDELRYATPNDLSEGADSDDPAIWVNPEDAAGSIVITAMKNGGLRVYDLNGTELQTIETPGIRYNNVDVLYDAGRGRKIADLAIASDRENDTLAIWKIDENGVLTDATHRKIPEIFGGEPGEDTAYGLAAYTAPDGKDYVFVTQADGNKIAQLELKPRGQDYTFEIVRMLELPVPEGEDPSDYQSEGIVIDRETGIGYVGVEEELGLLSFVADPNGPDTFETIAPIDSPFFAPDIEGVSIYYGDNGDGLILVSSQGDSSFAVFDRVDQTYLGSFAIGPKNGIDGVEESDGAEIYSGSLPGFENGLLVTQDGSNEAQVVFVEPGADETEVQNWNTNFKYTDFGDVLELFGKAANPDFDPRDLGTETLPQGVASGDVSTDSVVLWTRSLALGEVTFTVFEEKANGRFKKVATVEAEVTDIDLPVKVEIDGLDAGKSYVYKVEDAAGTEKSGEFRTAHEDGYNGLTFGVTGDWRGDLAPYPAVSNADEADLDFMVLGGDTIYADFDSPVGPATLELDGFREKYQEVYGSRAGENFFAELKASTAIFATIDDHEVVNDFAGGGLAADDPRLAETEGLVNDTAAYEEGLQAFQEYHPIADAFYGETGDPVTAGERALYRSQTFGQDAAVMILDQRSFRDQQIDGVIDPTNSADIVRFQTESQTLDRTLLGDVQLQDLKADLLEAEENGVTWKFVYTPEPIQDLGLNNADSWEGYKNERTEILKFIDDNAIDNVVFVAADIHATFVNNLTYSEVPLGPQIATSAFEITTGSVAFDPAFGPAVIGAIAGTPLLPPEQEAFYNSLPIAPDGDGILNDKDDFIREAFNSLAIDPLGLDRLGLDDNLTQAEGKIDATLLQGGWVSAHTYGWTEFDIDAETQALTVTTYGIPGYGPDEAGSNTDATPQIVSQFVVNPQDTVAAPLPELPSMLAAEEGWSTDVALTIGQTIEGTSGLFNGSTEGDYTPVGVLDGLGATKVDLDGDGHADVVRVFANHELLHFRGSEYEVSDGEGGTFTMTGARISFFDFDIETREITDSGLAYNTIVDANGDVASDTSFQPEAFAAFFGGTPGNGSELNGFSRFCSSVLVEAEAFGKDRGLEDTIYFAGEEDGTGFNSVGGAEWALDVETGTLYQVPAMGRGAWENVTQIDTGDKKHVAFILADDSSPFDFDGDGEDEAAPLFLYVGEKDRHSDDFLARNGLDGGKLYVWVADPEEADLASAIQEEIALRLEADGLSRREEIRLKLYDRQAERFSDMIDPDDGRETARERFAERQLERLADKLGLEVEGDAIDSPLEFRGTGNSTGGTWVEVDNSPQLDLASEDGSTGFDEYGYPTQGNLWLQAKDLGAFGFSRPEDVATNPDNGAEFVLASTGVDTFDVDPETGDGADTFGTIYTMEIDFKRGVPLASELKITYDTDDDPARALRSPDNLDWADDGKIYVQEDEAEEDSLTGEVLFGEGAANPNEAGIVAIDPETGELIRIANIDRSVVLDGGLENPADAFDTDAGSAGEWESSGILDVSDLFGEEGGSLFLTTVQAHGIEDQTDVNAESRINDGDLVEGGQLIFLSQDEFLY